MAKRMLINAVDHEECRVAIAEDSLMLELEVERADHTQLKGNIYKAAITRVEPSLQAAFLDIGSQRNGFLQINDINPTYFNEWPPEGEKKRYRHRFKTCSTPAKSW
jgi:ribonuclease E